jgi:hypothetical protein
VSNTGASPFRAASSKRSRTMVTNSDNFEGCIASERLSPSPISDSAKFCSHFGLSEISAC